MGKLLGEGEFGEVFEGNYRRLPPQDQLKVAVKTLKILQDKAEKDATLKSPEKNLGTLGRNLTLKELQLFSLRESFLKEAAIMVQFNHPNIVALIGVCVQPRTSPTWIVLEYMHIGALQAYLESSTVKGKKKKKKHKKTVSSLD